MNINNATKIAFSTPFLAESARYARSEWRLEGACLHFAVRRNGEHGGSYHSRRAVVLDDYTARAVRKLIREFPGLTLGRFVPA